MTTLNWVTKKRPESLGKWNAKVINKTNLAHVEIRKMKEDQEILISVSVVGTMRLRYGRTIENCNVRISSNVPTNLSFDEWQELKNAIKEAKTKLTKLNRKRNESIQNTSKEKQV